MPVVIDPLVKSSESTRRIPQSIWSVTISSLVLCWILRSLLQLWLNGDIHDQWLDKLGSAIVLCLLSPEASRQPGRCLRVPKILYVPMLNKLTRIELGLSYLRWALRFERFFFNIYMQKCILCNSCIAIFQCSSQLMIL